MLGGHIQIFDDVRWLWDRQAVFALTFQVQFDRFAQERFRFFDRGARGNAARQIRHVDTLNCRSFFNHDRVAFYGAIQISVEPGDASRLQA